MGDPEGSFVENLERTPAGGNQEGFWLKSMKVRRSYSG